MAARRCGICNINWPDDYSTYLKCPGCNSETRRNTDEQALTRTQAEYKKKELQFEEYYKDRGERAYSPADDSDRQRGIRHAEAIAKAEAQQEVLLILRDIPFMDEHPESGG